MTRRIAERITGMPVRQLDYGAGPGMTAFGIFADEEATEPLFMSASKRPKDALNVIVNWNWRRVSAIVLKRAGYACEDCRRIRPLQIHHRIFRSHGRRDIESNLLAICAPCHEKRHGR